MSNKKIGELLRDLRESKGLLLREVASKMNMDQALLSKIERNERRPTKDQIPLFAEAFDVQANELMVAYLSDKVISELENDDLALDALKAAEQKIKSNKKK